MVVLSQTDLGLLSQKVIQNKVCIYAHIVSCLIHQFCGHTFQFILHDRAKQEKCQTALWICFSLKNKGNTSL